MKKIAVLASGTKTRGGSGFEKLVEASHDGRLQGEIVCVLSNHLNGGVQERAKRLGIPFKHFEAPWTGEHCRELIGQEVDLICFSGWLKQAVGFDPTKTINIHPGQLPDFGGKGLYGSYVHQAVMKAHEAGEIKESAVCMHFVTDEYDQGPIFLRALVAIEPNDTPESLGKRVNKVEHVMQWQFTNHVLNGKISWDGVNHDSLSIAVE